MRETRGPPDNEMWTPRQCVWLRRWLQKGTARMQERRRWGHSQTPKAQSSVVDRQREEGFIQSGVFCILSTWLSKEALGGGERAGVTSRGGTHTAQQPPGHGQMFRLRGNVFNSFPLRV